MSVTKEVEVAAAQVVTPKPRKRRKSGSVRDENKAGWLFVSPALIILGVFLVAPILMAAWVALSDWTGRGSPFSDNVNFVGTENFAAVLTDGGLATRDFGTAMRNNIYYVLLVVPLQTIVALILAVLVSNAALKAKSFFRVAFYFPSITSSVAITVLWLFLFNVSGAVNAVLGWLSIDGPNWFNDPRGVLHIILAQFGVDQAPAALSSGGFLGISWWEWLSGPSVAWSAFILMAIFTTSGTFMLLFIAALQQINGEVQEAAMMDGANAWQRFRHVTVPMLKPTIFTVVTLGLIGCWQVFDQIYAAGEAGGPAKTTMTPAYLSFQAAFTNNQWGQGAAIAFILFFIIVLMTWFQRWVLRDKYDAKVAKEEKRRKRQKAREARTARKSVGREGERTGSTRLPASTAETDGKGEGK